MRKIIILTAVAVWLTTAGCAYKPEIQQGNLVTRDQLQKVKIGMEPRQVLFLLGSPLLKDPFHEKRWDYYYRLEDDGDERARYRITLWFENGKLARMTESGQIPQSERDALELLQQVQQPVRRR